MTHSFPFIKLIFAIKSDSEPHDNIEHRFSRCFHLMHGNKFQYRPHHIARKARYLVKEIVTYCMDIV